jgi:beta-lactamase regulating signal transducer with metallopeptidase domain/thiol-disulfide isomerase/thioredoxin
MTSSWNSLLSVGILVQCLNVIGASVVACLVALLLNRRREWSLPTRHALLVTALVVSMLAPVFLFVFDVPSIWPVSLSEALRPPAADSPAASLASRSVGGADQPEPLQPPVAMLPSNGDVAQDGPKTTHRSSPPPDLVEPASMPRFALGEQPRVAALPWARLCGTVLCGIWLAGMATGVVHAFRSLVRFRRWAQTLSIADSPCLADAARRAAASLGRRSGVPIYHSSLLPAPVTLGLLRPRIVVPLGIESSLPDEQLRAVILHEMAHIVRRDLWIGLLQQVAQVVYWWNPLVRLVNRRIADAREQICDDIAIRELAEPGAYAATLIRFAEQCGLLAPMPATLGIGPSPASQLEVRIRRILAPRVARCLGMTRRAAIGTVAAAGLMSATILLAQVRVAPTPDQQTDRPTAAIAPNEPTDMDSTSVVTAVDSTAAEDPTLSDLIQRMAAHERMYLPFDIKAIETFRFPDDLSPQERAGNLRADGRKRQRLMEYAQLERRIWRRKETSLVDDEIEQGPYEQFSDGERIVQVSPSPAIIDGERALEVHVNRRQNDIFDYLHATPLYGIHCLSALSTSELFSEAFQTNEEAVELAWDNGNARLTFGYGKPDWNKRFVLWLSRAHDWHPIRLQRFWDAKDELFHDEWEVTRFVRHGEHWRIAEGTHRYRDREDLKQPDAKIKYSRDFTILEGKYGGDVDERQFRYEIPPDARISDDSQPDAEPPPPAQTREITVNVVDVADQPISGASVRLPASRLRDWDTVSTDEQGVARSAKAPAGNVSVRITADGYRPVSWIMGDVNELRAIMVPRTRGIVMEGGQPAADAWITNESLQIRADGITYIPQRDWDGRDKDWTDRDGSFELKTNLTLRGHDVLVPFIAVHPSADRMAIRFVPARDLASPRKLELERVCHVRGQCLLRGMTESVAVSLGLETSSGQSIGFMAPRKKLTPEGLLLGFQVRLPPGDYLLKSRASSHHAGIEIPIAIPAGQAELNLPTADVPATGSVALRGQPAPELEVEWPSGQPATWEQYRGQVVVLDFWGTWCGPCVANMPALMDIAHEFRDQPVAWLSIHTPNLKSFDELNAEIANCTEKSWNGRELPFTALIDRPLSDGEYSGVTSRRYGIAEWPTLIVVDPDGRVVGPVPHGKLAETIGRLLDAASDE